MAIGTFKLEDIVKALEQFDARPPQTSLLVSSGIRDAIQSVPAQHGYHTSGNPLLAGYRQSYMGIGIEVADIPKQTVYDWSGCRSPARAQRRHKRGHPQRVKITQQDVAYLVDKAALRRMNEDWERRAIKMMFGNFG